VSGLFLYLGSLLFFVSRLDRLATNWWLLYLYFSIAAAFALFIRYFRVNIEEHLTPRPFEPFQVLLSDRAILFGGISILLFLVSAVIHILFDFSQPTLWIDLATASYVGSVIAMYFAVTLIKDTSKRESVKFSWIERLVFVSLITA